VKSDFADKIEQAVKDIESQSAAEVVVCLQDSSSNYRDLDLLWSVIFAMLTLGYKIWSPHHFHPEWIPINVLFCALLGFLLSSNLHGLRRLFLSSPRRKREVLRTARSEFTRLGVGRTTDRTGLLIYLSRFERSLVMVPDLTLEQKIVPGLWEDWNHRFGFAASESELLSNLQELLSILKGPLGRQLPRTDDDINELPDSPVESK
jgi:putative membrane protein